MIDKKEAVDAYKRLILHRMASVGSLAPALFLQKIGLGKEFQMNTLVYQGDQFIPYAVRKAANEPIEELQKYIQPWLTVDEAQFRITLNYKTEIPVDQEQFCEVLYIFDDLAVKWREIFEEHDRQDLVYVPSQSK
ncbi:MAG: hypothetical protein JSR46_04180 [Verrucomicrobia bacterium]|nr:hypothetical protein [Verrucomicrobiota bacterium]